MIKAIYYLQMKLSRAFLFLLFMSGPADEKGIPNLTDVVMRGVLFVIEGIRDGG